MKYNITKTNGAPIDVKAQYFVLRIDGDRLPEQAALRKYAEEAWEAGQVENATAAMKALNGPDWTPESEKPKCEECGSKDLYRRGGVGFEGLWCKDCGAVSSSV